MENSLFSKSACKQRGSQSLPVPLGLYAVSVPATTMILITCGTHLHHNFSGVDNNALWMVTGTVQSMRAVLPCPCEARRRIFQEVLEKNHE